MPTFDEHEGLTIDWTMFWSGFVVWPALFMSIPPSEWNTSSSWFKYAAVMFWYSIAGHTQYGRRYFYPWQKYVPDRTPPLKEHGGRTKSMNLIKTGGVNLWNYINYSFFVSGLLSWQWSSTGGPTNTIEQIIFWSNFGFGILCGQSFYTYGWYQPLIPLLVAPAMQLVALAKA